MFFGTTKGAYTGAVNTPGLFEQAENGTIFLDEINSMDMALQAKILKVIENRTVRRIGADKETEIRCRILCALNEDPVQCIEDGKLRRDLYYRLSSCILHIPPLRERKSDIPLYCNYFLSRFNKEYSQRIERMDEGLLSLFMSYNWPGNVRELQHVIESAYSVAEESIRVLKLENISSYYKSSFVEENGNSKIKTAKMAESIVDEMQHDTASEDFTPQPSGLKNQIDAYEKKIIARTLAETNGNVTVAAQILEITRQALQHKIRKYEIQH